MAGPVAIDTPDYQVGIVSPQLLLASVPANVESVTVGIPPNAETLVVLASIPLVSAPVICSGTSSGRTYIGLRAIVPGGPDQDANYFFDVSQVTDTEVDITLPTASATAWYVYADSGVHLISDVSNQRSYNGQLYVTPVVPNTIIGDHPPNELEYASGLFTSSGALVAAPGSGERLRIFALTLSNATSGANGLLQNGSGGTTLLAVASAQSLALPLPGQGVPLSADTALYVTIEGSTLGCFATAFYTTESI